MPTETTKRRGRSLTVLLAMQLMVILDGTIVTVALPSIQDSLGFSATGLAWVVNAYLIAFAGLLLLSGRLGDLLGTKRVFVTGLIVFTAASALAGLAVNPAMLVIGRFAQGVGGALASAVILGMIVGLYPKPGEQARAMGIYSFVSAGGGAIGLIAGGVITQTLGWQGAFLVNLPIGAIVLPAALRLLRPERGLGLRQGADLLGALLVTAGLSLGVFAIIQSAEPSAEPATVAGYGAVAVLLLVAFTVRQARAARPLLPLRLFRNRITTVANLVVVLVFAAGFGFQFFTALYLRRVLEFDALQTGLAFLPAPVTLGTVSLFVANRVIGRFGSRTALLSGLFGLGAGLVLLGRMPMDGDYLVDLVPALLLMGAGMGLSMPALIMTAMSGANPADAGLASGLNNTAQQVGAAVGLAVLASLAATVSGGETAASVLRDGYRLATLVAAGFVFAGLVIAWLALRPARTALDSEEPTLSTARA